MLALATHARRTVLLRATHPKLLLDVRWASTVSAAGEPVKRPRGRPPKVREPEEPVKKKPGRPPKVVEPVEPPVKRKPGRPPKVPEPVKFKIKIVKRAPGRTATVIPSTLSQPSEPSEPSKPSEPNEPSKPSQLSEPSEGIEPLEPIEPSELIKPKKPSNPRLYGHRPLARPRGRPRKDEPVDNANGTATGTPDPPKPPRKAPAIAKKAQVWLENEDSLAAADDIANDEIEPTEPFKPMEYFEPEEDPEPKKKIKSIRAGAPETRKYVNPHADGKELKKELDRDGTWLAARRLKQGGNRDIYRVNLISDQLARDTLKYMGPTLKRHEGCDLLDIFPGPGIWSKRLHDVVKPRSHILMEPDAEFYKPYLEPLLEKPGTQLLPESGIVWEQLNKVLNPTVLPHQVERKYTPEETPERNDTLLVTMNLAMSPRRKFRSFESLAQLVMFQMLSSIRPGSLFQKYGLVRMLIWAEDADTKAILPRTIQARKKLAIEAELSTDWVTQLVSPDAPRPTAAGASRWYLRSESLNLESARRALVRMQDQGFKLIRGREPEHVREFFDFVDPDKSAGPKNQFTRKGRPGDIELVQLQKEWDDGTIQEGSKEHKRLSHLVHLQTFDSRRAVVTERLMREHDAIVRDYVKAGDDEAKQQEVLARAKAWTDTINKFEKKTRNEIVLLRDNRHVVKQDKPFMNWDRRYIEPLRAEPQEFFPAAPCVLLDIQPRAVPSILREIGPTSSRGGDMFELLLRGLVQHILDPVDGCMNTITPGAGDWVVPHCKTMHDPTVGGHVPGLLWPSTRTLSTDHLVELTEQWMKWPFRPSYEQLVSRTIEEADAEPGEDGREANKLKLPMEL